MANFAKKKLPQTGIRFTTNGTLLNSEYCKRIINPGIERVAISLDVISYNDGDAGIVHPTTGEILENIKELLNLRSKKRYPKVSLQTVIRPDSMQELISVIRFGADVGIDYLNLVRLDTRRDSSLIRPSLQEEFGISDMPRKRHDAWDSRYSQSMTSLSFFAWLVILIKSACVAWIQFILLSTGK